VPLGNRVGVATVAALEGYGTAATPAVPEFLSPSARIRDDARPLCADMRDSSIREPGAGSFARV